MLGGARGLRTVSHGHRHGRRPGRPLSSPARASPACRPHPAPLLARHARTVHSGEPRRLPRAPPSSARVTRGPSGRAEVPQDPPASCSKASPEPCPEPEPEPGVHEPLSGPPVRPALPAAGPGRPDRWPACSCSTQLVLGGCFGDSSPRPGGPPGLPCGELFPPRPAHPAPAPCCAPLGVPPIRTPAPPTADGETQGAPGEPRAGSAPRGHVLPRLRCRGTYPVTCVITATGSAACHLPGSVRCPCNAFGTGRLLSPAPPADRTARAARDRGLHGAPALAGV